MTLGCGFNWSPVNKSGLSDSWAWNVLFYHFTWVLTSLRIKGATSIRKPSRNTLGLLILASLTSQSIYAWKSSFTWPTFGCRSGGWVACASVWWQELLSGQEGVGLKMETGGFSFQEGDLWEMRRLAVSLLSLSVGQGETGPKDFVKLSAPHRIILGPRWQRGTEMGMSSFS